MAANNEIYLEKVKKAQEINVILNLINEMIKNDFFYQDFNEELKKEFKLMVKRFLTLKELEEFDDKLIQNLIR